MAYTEGKDKNSTSKQKVPTSSDYPKVSIVIPTFNVEGTLQTCLDSIYVQEYPNLEIIVIDGASSDSTVSILKSNSNNIDFWISEKDKGIYDAMNKGVNHATGDWLYFMGADDELYPEFSDLARELKDAGSIYYGSVFCRGRKCEGYIKRYYQAKQGMYHQSMIYPVNVFKYHKYNLRYRISADYVLNMELAGDKRFKFAFRDYIVAKFNHTGLSGNSGDEELAKDKSALILKNFGYFLWLRFVFRQFKGKLKTLLIKR